MILTGAPETIEFIELALPFPFENLHFYLS